MKKIRKAFAILLAAWAIVGTAAAEGGGPAKTLCAITSTLTCDLTGCISGPANAVNLPVFVRIDTQNNLVETAREGGDRRTSRIASMRAEGDTLVLLGGEMETGWSATLDQVTGNFTGTVADNGVGYIIFGSCLAY